MHHGPTAKPSDMTNKENTASVIKGKLKIQKTNIFLFLIFQFASTISEKKQKIFMTHLLKQNKINFCI